MFGLCVNLVIRKKVVKYHFGRKKIKIMNKFRSAEKLSSVDITSERKFDLSQIQLKQLRKLREYYTEFYSGQQVRAYINDVLLDLVAIGWNATQNKMPVYGFASQLFDAVAEGTFIVNGEFTLAFKDIATMHFINQHIRGQEYDAEIYAANIKKLRTLPSASVLYEMGPGSVGLTPIVGKIQELTIDEEGNVVPDGTKGKIYVSKNRIEDLFGGPDNFDDLCDALEDSIWGIGDYYKNKYRRADEIDKERKYDSYGIGYDTAGKGFNLLITYGNPNNSESEHSLKVLNDVHILGSAQSIDPNAGFIIETFSFFARNMDQPMSNYKGFDKPNIPTDKIGRAPDVSRFPISLTLFDHCNKEFFEETAPNVLGVNITFIILAIKDKIRKLKTKDKNSRSYFVKSEILIPSDWVTDNPRNEIRIIEKGPVVRKNLLNYFAGKIHEIIKNAAGVSDAAFSFVTNASSSLKDEFIINIAIE